MNFDDIKKEMNDSVANIPSKPNTIDLKKGKNNPIYMIRKNMIEEVIVTAIAMIVFLAFPFFSDLKMSPLAKSTYLILMTLTTIMIGLYVVKLICFLRRVSKFEMNTKDAIKDYIYEIKLTLESYKAYVIASSLLVPIPSFAIISSQYGSDDISVLNFEKWMTLQINTKETLILILSYLAFGVFVYLTITLWSRFLYGKHVKNLEAILQNLGEEE